MPLLASKKKSVACPRRYTPFGEGLVTLALNPVDRIDNQLNLWHVSNLKSPVYTFFGHHGLVTEFCWRNRSVIVRL